MEQNYSCVTFYGHRTLPGKFSQTVFLSSIHWTIRVESYTTTALDAKKGTGFRHKHSFHMPHCGAQHLAWFVTSLTRIDDEYADIRCWLNWGIPILSINSPPFSSATQAPGGDHGVHQLPASIAWHLPTSFDSPWSLRTRSSEANGLRISPRGTKGMWLSFDVAGLEMSWKIMTHPSQPVYADDKGC